jgi:hypothetical protein
VLKLFPKVTVCDGYPRYVIDRNRVTGGGISSGLDEAMAIVCMLFGEEPTKIGQLTMQYNPDPPFCDGDPSVAEPGIVNQVRSNLEPGVEALAKAVKDIQKSFPHPQKKSRGA